MDARVPPYNMDAEKAILGSILLNNHAFALVQGIVTPEDFYLEAHRRIFAVMQELAQKSTPIDHVTLGSALIQGGHWEQIGGVDALDGLTQTVGTVSNVEYYARLVRQDAQIRRMIYAAQEVVNQGFQRGQEPEEYLDAAEQAIFKAAQQRTTETYASVGTILKETYDHLEEASKRTGDITGVPSGFPELDRWTAGFQPSDLIIIAGRPAMGKTTFAMNIACAAARTTQKPSLVFSLEMSREQLVRRMLASEGRVEAHKLRIPHRLTTDDWRKLTDVSNLLYGIPLYIDDSTPIYPLDIRSRARRLQAERGLGLVVIDYLQLMQAGLKRKESREQEIAEISRSLKGLAKELHVPVIALSQLNRGVEARSDKRPLMSDLRESGSIEQDSDLILFLYRDEVYNKDTTERNIAEVIIGKQRSGPTSTVRLRFSGEYTRFDNLSENEEPSGYGTNETLPSF